MPDILIRMEMPGHCFNCSTKIDPDNRKCNIDGHVFVETLSKLTCRRDENCPLHELPPHGDLIDLSELQKFPIRLDHYDKEHGDEHFVYGIESLMEYAECLPVVVPAEREGET